MTMGKVHCTGCGSVWEFAPGYSEAWKEHDIIATRDQQHIFHIRCNPDDHPQRSAYKLAGTIIFHAQILDKDCCAIYWETIRTTLRKMGQP